MFFLRVICSPQEADQLSAELWEAGTEGIQELERGDGVELIAGFPDASRGSELLTHFAAWSPEWEQQADTDWIAFSEESWPPREVGGRIFLAAPWFKGETPANRVRILHNPGLASGTGEHPCTQLALEALETHVQPGTRVLDIGTGSGMLAIAALGLGAASAIGLDNDENALVTARENFLLNGLAPSLVAGSVDCLAPACADLTVANISGSVLLSLFDDLIRIGRPDSWLILTGFNESELKVFETLLPGSSVTALNEWRCVSGQLSSA